MRKRTYLWLFASLALVGVTTDQLTKYHVFQWLYNGKQRVDEGKFQTWVRVEPWHEQDSNFIHGGRYNLLPGWFGFQAEYHHESHPESKPCDCCCSSLQTWSAPDMPVVNQGALFGMGNDHKTLANRIFAGISLVAIVGILTWVVFRGRRVDGWLLAALGLILGGTMGNFYDRVLFNGVRDFLYFYKVRWPVFNVADCCLVCGAIMLLIHAFFLAPPDPKPAETAAAGASTNPPAA